MTNAKRFLWGLIGLYGCLFFGLNALKYRSYAFHDFDLAVYAQGLWNILHGSFESSLLGIPLLGNHFVPILFLILPLYAVFPSPVTLLFLQTLFLGGGAHFVYRIAERHLPEPSPLIFAFSYLFYPALGYVSLFEFHPVALGVFFLLGALDAFERERSLSFWIFAALALLCQEDVSLAVMMIGVLALLKRRGWRWSFFPFFIGGTTFVFVVFWFMPRLNPETINFSLLYSHLGENLPDALRFIVTHPLKTLSLLFEGPLRKQMVMQLLAPLAFFPLLDPKSFVLSLPFFMEHLLSQRRTQHLLNYHYGALFIPLLFYAAIHGGKRLIGRLSVKVIWGLLFSMTLIVNVWAGPHFRLSGVMEEAWPDVLDAKRDILIRRLPPTAPVMATFEFLPHLVNRRELYSFHHVYTGTYTLSKRPYAFPETLPYLLVDWNDPLTHVGFSREDSDESARRFLEERNFQPVLAFEDLVLFEKDAKGTPLFWVERKNGTPDLAAEDPDGALGLFRWTAASRTLPSGEALPLTFEWVCRHTPSRRYGILFEMVEAKQKKIRRHYHPFLYRLYPTDRWQPGERITEHYRLVFPESDFSGATWSVVLYWVDEREGSLFPLVDLGEFVIEDKNS